jgi:hypothetical protein
MSKRGALAIDDCGRCKRSLGTEERASIGCGYVPRGDRVHLSVWQPPDGRHGYSGPELTTCAGYTCNLPEVREVALARIHWGKGNANVLGPSEELLDCIVVMESSYNQLQSWLLTPSKDGGGGS